MLRVAKPGPGPLEFAAPLDVDIEGAVGEHVSDLVIIEERFEGAEPDHVVGKFDCEPALLCLVEVDPLLRRNLVDKLGHIRLQVRPRHAAGYRRIDARHQNHSDLLFQPGIGAVVGREAFLRGPRNDDEIASGGVGDAAAEPVRSHFEDIHQRLRCGGRPEISRASVARPPTNGPRLAAGMSVPAMALANSLG